MSRPNRVLWVVALAQGMIAVDSTVMNIALPTMQADLGFADGARHWVITAYALTFGALLLPGSRIADRGKAGSAQSVDVGRHHVRRRVNDRQHHRPLRHRPSASSSSPHCQVHSCSGRRPAADQSLPSPPTDTKAKMHTSRIDGRTILITGASSGIGYFIAEGLARLGAHIIVAARSAEKAQSAIDLLPEPARHRHLQLDLSDLESIRAAGAEIAEGSPLDGLVMNAGVIAASPTYTTGPFGVESTVDVNTLAHTELFRLARPALERAPSARVVSTGSMLTRTIPFDPNNWLAQTSYRPRVSYAMSKHAAEILGLELDRRLIDSGSNIRSVVAHPGGAIDALTPDRAPLHRRSPLTRLIAPAITPLFSRVVQGKESAAQPAIAAITTPALPAQAYIGPRHRATGAPEFATPVPSSSDTAVGAWLWNEVEAILTHPIFPSR